MDRIEAVLNGACEDQRDALRMFHRTGSADDAARVHYEACLSCERALDALAELRAATPAVPPSAAIQGNRPAVVAFYLGTWICILAGGGFLGYLLVSQLFAGREEAVSQAERMERGIRFVRMPNRTDLCVGGFPGVGGFGPSFVGSASCRAVEDRVVFDEDMSFHLGLAVVVRIKGTQACLASVGDSQFTLPCRAGDD